MADFGWKPTYPEWKITPVSVTPMERADYRLVFIDKDGDVIGEARIKCSVTAVGAIMRAIMRSEPVQKVEVQEKDEDLSSGWYRFGEMERGGELKWL